MYLKHFTHSCLLIKEIGFLHNRSFVCILHGIWNFEIYGNGDGFVLTSGVVVSGFYNKPIWASLTPKMLARTPKMFNRESPGTPKKSRLMIKMNTFHINAQLGNFIDYFFFHNKST